MPVYAYVGTYTTENYKNNRNAHGKGIYVFRIEENGTWIQVQIAEGLNPAVLAFRRNMDYLYCVNTNSGNCSAYQRDKQTGLLTYLNSEKTPGENVMVMSVSPSGDCLISADKSGLVACLPIGEDGKLKKEFGGFTLPGQKGPLNEKIQPHSRPHHVPFSPDGRYILIADKGLDLVHSYRINFETKHFEEIQHLPFRPASCPRHISFHPNGHFAYVNTEYTSTVVACHYNPENGTLAPFQIVPSIPDDYVEIKNTSSEIMVGNRGKNLYVSNRGMNSIGVFSVNQEDGRLSPIQWGSTKGVKPRFFTIEPGEKYLYACNQMSDTIVEFEIDLLTGCLTQTGNVIETPVPVWILFSGSVPCHKQSTLG